MILKKLREAKHMLIKYRREDLDQIYAGVAEVGKGLEDEEGSGVQRCAEVLDHVDKRFARGLTLNDIVQEIKGKVSKFYGLVK